MSAPSCVKEIVNAYTISHTCHTRTVMNHRPWYGISLALGGRIIYRHGGKEFVSDVGDIVILPKNQSYELECTRSGSFALINFLLDTDIDLDTFRIIKIQKSEKFLALYHKLESLFMTRGRSRGARLLSCFYEIVAFIIEEKEKSALPPVLKKALVLVEGNIENASLSNLWLASMLQISEVYLRKLFAANLSTSPKQYIQTLRLDRAKSMLANTAESVSVISEKCGYSSVYMFCRAFKVKCGMTPTEYRKENQIRII